MIPVVYLYFLKKSFNEPNYRRNVVERFGFTPAFKKESIWIHAVSLGELRAAIPLIQYFLEKSEYLIITTITPAGRDEAKRHFSEEIKNDNVLVIYLPLEYDLVFHWFFSRYRPKLGLILEYELWPVMITSCVKHDVPIVLAQAQYVEKSFVRDKKLGFRRSLLDCFDLILAKSDLHAERFRARTITRVDVMGELRFEQEIKSDHIEEANNFLKAMKLTECGRAAFCFGSTGPGEDEGLIRVMQMLIERSKSLGKPKPFFVYVPRHKKDFQKIRSKISASGLIFVDRTEILDSKLVLNTTPQLDMKNIDGLFGNSLGEINFYFQIADFVFIGNSFNDLGAHNIIEPLALRKPVVVGPSVWGIEYPVKEALQSNIVHKVETFEELSELWISFIKNPKLKRCQKDRMVQFHEDHAGAVKRCILKLNQSGFL